MTNLAGGSMGPHAIDFLRRCLIRHVPLHNWLAARVPNAEHDHSCTKKATAQRCHPAQMGQQPTAPVKNEGGRIQSQSQS